MSKHTPGPWNVVEHDYIVSKENRDYGRIIARILKIDISDPAEEANAHLIAAAPEMFALLEEIESKRIYLGAKLTKKITKLLDKADGTTRKLSKQI